MTIPVYFIVQCCSWNFIARVRKKFTAYKARLGKSTFSHFIANAQNLNMPSNTIVCLSEKIAVVRFVVVLKEFPKCPPTDISECVWNVKLKDLELGEQFPSHSFVTLSRNLDLSQFTEIFGILDFCQQQSPCLVRIWSTEKAPHSTLFLRNGYTV